MTIQRVVEGLRCSDSHGHLREIAFLERQDSDDARAALTRATDHPDEQTRCFAVSALGKVPTRNAILMAHLRDDPSVMVRCACARELGNLEGPFPELSRSLIDALADSDWRVVHMACLAFRRQGAEHGAAEQAEAEAAIRALRELLDHASWKIRFAACEALYHLGGIDQRATSTLETLDQDPAAVEHNEILLGWRQAEEETGGPGLLSLTTEELLRAAKQYTIASASRSR